MKLLVLGAGHLKAATAQERYEILDPFLYICQAMTPYFSSVAIEVNVSGSDLAMEDLSEDFPALDFAVTVHYKSFLDYFRRPENFSPRKMRRLWRAIKAADVVLFRLPGPVAVPAYAMTRLLRKDYVVFVASDLHQIADNLLSAPLLRNRIRGRMIRTLARFFSDRVARNAYKRFYLSKKIRENYGDSDEPKATLFTTSIISQVYPPKLVRFDTRTVQLIFLGRLVPEKGLKTLADILRGLSDAGWNAHLSMIGEGRGQDSFEDALGSLRSKVTFHGWISDRAQIESLLCIADFCLLPSHNEGTPKVIFEAMATGTIFVGTRVGGIPDIIEDGKDGLLFDPGKASEAVKKMVVCLEDPARYDAIVREALEKAKTHTLESRASTLARNIKESTHNSDHPA